MQEKGLPCQEMHAEKIGNEMVYPASIPCPHCKWYNEIHYFRPQDDYEEITCSHCEGIKRFADRIRAREAEGE